MFVRASHSFDILPTNRLGGMVGIQSRFEISCIRTPEPPPSTGNLSNDAAQPEDTTLNYHLCRCYISVCRVPALCTTMNPDTQIFGVRSGNFRGKVVMCRSGLQ